MENGTSSTLPSNKPEPDSQLDPRLTTKLDQSLVVAKDLSLQPTSKYVLLTGAGRPVYYAVDGYNVDDETIAFWRGAAHDLVYLCRREGTWALVARNVVDVVTDGDMAKHMVAEGKVVEAFYEGLDPAGFAEAKKMALVEMMAGNGHSHMRSPLPEDSKPVPGQYL